MATLRESLTTGSDAYQPIYGNNRFAQTFTPAAAYKITSVKLLLYRTGSAPDMTVSIRPTSSDLPVAGSINDLCSGTVVGSTLPTASPYEWREVTLGGGYELEAGVKYAIVCVAQGGDASNYIRWRVDTSSPPYAGGNVCHSGNDVTWNTTSPDQDALFEVWGEDIEEEIPPPDEESENPEATLREYLNEGSDNYQPVYGNNWFGQLFTAESSYRLTSVKLLLYRTGSAPDMTVSIRPTSSDLPVAGSINDLCAGLVEGDTLPTSSPYEWREISMGDGYDIEEGVTYAVVLKALGGDSSNCIKWRVDASSPPYTGGALCVSANDTSWDAVSPDSDGLFEIWGKRITDGGGEPINPDGILCGYLSGGLTSEFPYELITHGIIERLIPTSPSNLTLLLDGISAAQIQTQVANIHAAGKKALMDIYTGWTVSEYNTALGNATRRAELIASCVSLQSTYNLDGFDFDWESDVQSNWSNNDFDTLVAALYAALPAGKNIITAAVPMNKIVVNASTVSNYMHHIHPMIYDSPANPAYGSLTEFQNRMNYWKNTGGIDPAKIAGGVRYYWYDWVAWRYIVAGYAPLQGVIAIPDDSQNSTTYSTGTLIGTGFNLMKEKAQWARDNGFGGMMVYTLNGDALGERSFTQALYAIIVRNNDAFPYTFPFTFAPEITTGAAMTVESAMTASIQTVVLTLSALMIVESSLSVSLSRGALLEAQLQPATKPLVRLVLSKTGEDTLTYYNTDRFIACPYHVESDDSYRAQLILDNSDNLFSSMDFRGYDVAIAWGMVTPDGNLYIEKAPLKVLSQYAVSAPGVSHIVLNCASILDLMADQTASQSYDPADFEGEIRSGTGEVQGSPWGLEEGDNVFTIGIQGTARVTLGVGTHGTASSGTATVVGSPVILKPGNNTITISGTGTITINAMPDTLKDVIEGILSGTGYGYSAYDPVELVWDSEDSVIDSLALRDTLDIYIGESRLSKLNLLLGYSKMVKRLHSDGKIHFLNPVISGSSYAYKYELSGEHPFFSKVAGKTLVVPNAIGVIYGGFLGSARDDASYAVKPKWVAYYNIPITSDDEGNSVAGAMLQRVTLAAQSLTVDVPMNVFQRVWDYVDIVDSRDNTEVSGNVQYISRHFDTRSGDFGMSVKFGGTGNIPAGNALSSVQKTEEEASAEVAVSEKPASSASAIDKLQNEQLDIHSQLISQIINKIAEIEGQL